MARPYGDKWRILAHRLDTRESISLEGDGESEFDELVIGNNANDPCWFHLEQKTDKAWWFAIYLDLDSLDRVTGWITVNHTGRNQVTIDYEGGTQWQRLVNTNDLERIDANERQTT